MKKKVLAIMLVAVSIMVISACGKKRKTVRNSCNHRYDSSDLHKLFFSILHYLPPSGNVACSVCIQTISVSFVLIITIRFFIGSFFCVDFIIYFVKFGTTIKCHVKAEQIIEQKKSHIFFRYDSHNCYYCSNYSTRRTATIGLYAAFPLILIPSFALLACTICPPPM